MKIHVVQSGDTLSTIAEKYNVEVNKLREMNKQIASPESMMPGMKIKIPSTSKPVKMEMRKETNVASVQDVKQPAEHPYKDVSPMKMPVIAEDDGLPFPEKKLMPYVEEKPEMPSIPTMPMMDDVNVNIHMEESSSSDHYYFNIQQNQGFKQQSYPAVPYTAPTYHYQPKSKPCSCSSPFTYYMPVYPMQNPYNYPNQQAYPYQGQHMQQSHPSQQQMHYALGQYPQMDQYNQGQYPQMGQYNQAQYPQMEMNEETPIDLPEVPEQYTNEQQMANMYPYGYPYNLTQMYQQPNQWMQANMSDYGGYDYPIFTPNPIAQQQGMPTDWNRDDDSE